MAWAAKYWHLCTSDLNFYCSCVVVRSIIKGCIVRIYWSADLLCISFSVHFFITVSFTGLSRHFPLGALSDDFLLILWLVHEISLVIFSSLCLQSYAYSSIYSVHMHVFVSSFVFDSFFDFMQSEICFTDCKIYGMLFQNPVICVIYDTIYT